MKRSRDAMAWPADTGEQQERQSRSLRVLERFGHRYVRAIHAGVMDVEVHRLRAEELVRRGAADAWLATGTYNAGAARALRLTQQLLLLPFVAAALAHHPALGALALAIAPMMYWLSPRSHMPGFTMTGRFGRAVVVPPGKLSKDYAITCGVGAVLSAVAGSELRWVAIWFAIWAAYHWIEHIRFTAAETTARRMLEEGPASARFLVEQDVVLLRE